MAGRSMSWGQGEERERILVNTVVPLDATVDHGMWPYDAEQKEDGSSRRTRDECQESGPGFK